MTDVDGKRYLDLLAGYSALNFGHGHPALLASAHAQLDQLTLTSRAFVHDQFADFTAALGDLCGKDLVLPMNTGAEAVETAIKAARKWGYGVKGIPADQAEIIVAAGNFHGRTTTIVGSPTNPTIAAASARSRPASSRCRSATSRRSRPRSPRHRGRADRADPGRGRRRHSAGGLPPRRARALHRERRAVHRRRDPVRPRPHRQDVRLRARGHRARRLHPRQGARRRHRAGVRVRREPRSARRPQARPARQHVRRQPAGLRGRPHRRRHARDRRAPGPRDRRSAS